jgi:tetratricopeptide (TPR) repeat protein
MPAPGPAGDAPQAEASPPAGSLRGTQGRDATRREAILHGLLRHRRLWAIVVVFAALAAVGFALARPRANAWYHFRAARADLLAYHNPQAIRHLQVCLRVWPDDPDVLFLSARAARRAGQYNEAEHWLEKYRQARGLDDAGSFEELLLSAERRVDQAAAECRRRVEQGDPDSPLILEALARGYLRQYRLGEAGFSLDQWLKRQPDNPQALCLKGQFHLDYEHAPDRAADSYRRAVQLDPENEEARLGLALVLLQSKSFAQAAEQMEYLRRCQPHNPRVEVGLAECRDALGQPDAALRQVEDVLARQADYAPALALRGQLALEAGQYEEAEDWLRRAAARAPGDHQARYNLILCLHHNRKPEEAKRHEEELREWEDAVKRFNEIVTREMPKRPHDPDLHYQLGRLLLRSGHAEEGVRWLQSALQVDPGHAAARQALAEYAEQSKSRPAKD